MSWQWARDCDSVQRLNRAEASWPAHTVPIASTARRIGKGERRIVAVCERVGGIASVRWGKHTSHNQRNGARMWPILFPHTLVIRCLDATGAGMVRALTNGQMPADKERTAHARVKYRMTRQKSTVETIRNNQAIRPSHNGIVIMQTTQAQNNKQRKRDNADNANVMMPGVSPRHNGIVISPCYAQAFVTKRNISAAYLSHKPGLSVQAYYVTVKDWHKYMRTIVHAYYYAAMRILRYRYMIICTYEHKIIKQQRCKIILKKRDTTLAGS